MWTELLQGGAGMLLIGFGVKYLLPILKSRLEADASRSGVDATVHNLYQELLLKQNEVINENHQLKLENSQLKQELKHVKDEKND